MSLGPLVIKLVLMGKVLTKTLFAINAIFSSKKTLYAINAIFTCTSKDCIVSEYGLF